MIKSLINQRIKLGVVLVCMLTCLSVSASQDLNVNLSLKLSNMPLREVLKIISDKTNANFAYNPAIVPADKLISVEADNKKLGVLLEEMLTPLGMHFFYAKDVIVIEKKGKAVEKKAISQQQIKGIVRDMKGQPIPGVSVRNKQTGTGVSTDNEGVFMIPVSSSNDSLLISYTGYENQLVAVANKSALLITLQENMQALDEVVVVGYGTQKRKDLVGAVGVASRQDFGDVAVSNTSQLIQGKLSGVQVINNSGNPGSGTQIVVRGTGSFTSASPLYVIDGIQSDVTTFNSISPYDIEDISVLKDASSVAIYGAQGANGVVLVTTRKAKTGLPRITYDGYIGMARPWKQFEMLDAAQYTDMVREWYVNYGQPLPSRVGTDEALITETDWQDEMFRTATLHEHHFGIGGGTENVRYNASIGYTNQQSQVVAQDYSRANIRLNLEENVGKRIRLGQQLSVRHQLTKGVAADVLAGLRMPPYISVYDETNTLGGFGIATSFLDGNDSQNPLIQPSLRDVRDRGFNNYLQLFGELDIIEGLKFRSQIAGTYNFNQNYNYNPTYAGNQLVTQAQIVEGYNYDLGYIWENYFSYSKRLGSSSFDFTLGNSFRSAGVSRSVSTVGSDFANEEIHQIGVAKNVSMGSASANSGPRFISYFARANYQYKDRYILTLTGRRDATSLFGPDNRVGYFPSVGLGWRISDESFLKGVDFITDMKIRASWGKTGNSNIDGFSYQSRVWTGSGNSVVYPLGTSKTLVNGATVAIASSPDLRWEETTTTDIGVDATLFENKLTIGAGYYNRKNNDLLVEVPLALSTGYGGVDGASSSQLINAASTYNKGVELSLGYTGKAGDLFYAINVNGSYNKNEVVSLGTQGAVPIMDGSFYSVPSMSRTEVGRPIGSFYGYVYDHVAVDETDVARYNAMAKEKTGDANAEYQAGLLPGDRIFKDLDGDGQVTEADKTFLGSPIPKWNYGLNIRLSYRQFDFMAALQGVAGVELINGMKYYLEGMALPFNAKTEVLSRWKNPGDVTDIARAGQNYGTAANLRPSSWFVENGAYARIRSVTLGYTFVPDKLKKLTSNTVTSLRLYLTAQNLFTFTGYSGYDPEVIGSGDFIFARGIDTGQIPQPRTFMFGAQLGF